MACRLFIPSTCAAIAGPFPCLDDSRVACVNAERPLCTAGRAAFGYRSSSAAIRCGGRTPSLFRNLLDRVQHRQIDAGQLELLAR
jgi:hypothetical protein